MIKKQYLLLLTLFIMSCSSYKPVYISNTTLNVQLVLDSIQTADDIQISDTSLWLKTPIVTNQGMMINRLFYLTKDGRQYIITLMNKDSVYHYKYRIE